MVDLSATPLEELLRMARGENEQSVIGPAITQGDPPAQATPTEALAFSVVAFVTALAGHLDRTFEEADQLVGGTPFNLWPLVDSPAGWTALALLLSPPGEPGPFLTPTIH